MYAILKGGLWFQDGKYTKNIFRHRIYVDRPIFHSYCILRKNSGLPKHALEPFWLHVATFFSSWNLFYSGGNTLNVSDHKIYVGLPIFQQQWGRLQYFDSDLLHHARENKTMVHIHFCLTFTKRGRPWLKTITHGC